MILWVFSKFRMQSSSPRVTSVDSWDPHCGFEGGAVPSEDVDTWAGRHELAWNIAQLYSSSTCGDFLSDSQVESDSGHGSMTLSLVEIVIVLIGQVIWFLDIINIEHQDKENESDGLCRLYSYHLSLGVLESTMAFLPGTLSCIIFLLNYRLSTFLYWVVVSDVLYSAEFPLVFQNIW